jgi:glycosyltransferase involved in cell wall biosynthesis
MVDQEQKSSDRLLIFELGYGGHYPSYIRYLCDYWRKQKQAGKLFMVVSPQFLQQHQDVVEFAAGGVGGNEVGDRPDTDVSNIEAADLAKLQDTAANIEFISITEPEADQLTPRSSPLARARRALQEWQLLRQYAQCLKASHCLLLYLDSFQTAIALHQQLPCPFSGIYFRPTFHYRQFSDYVATRKEKIQVWRERFILPRVLHNPQLHSFFCLDPFAVKPINHLTGTTKAVYLPDPVVQVSHVQTQVEEFKQKLGIKTDRTSLLLFGALYDRRKGLIQVLEALLQLEPERQRKICLVLAGQLFRTQKPEIDRLLIQLEQNSVVQLVIQDQFVSEAEMKLFYASADIILAPYQRHVGMSGIVVEAAAAGRPLICSDYGLMGQVVRQYQLGITVDATDPSAIAQGIKKCLSMPIVELGDRTQMQAYAKQNSAAQFTNTIFSYITN